MEKHKITILLVDDKKANLLALEQLLVAKERNIIKSTSGEDALKTAFNNDIDLIVLDVNMPGMDGFEVAQLLKSNKRTKDIPIIFATAEMKEQKFMARGMEEGAIDYLFKPLDPGITKAKVDVLLKIQQQKKQLLEKNRLLERYALLINNCSDLICTIDAQTLKFEEINNAFNTLLGYELDEIRGTSLMYYVSNDDRESIKGLIDRKEKLLDFETNIYCKSREIKCLHWNVVVKEGKWYANARDITQAKQVEKIKHYLSTVVKQSSDAIYIHDLAGNINSWNQGAERIYGFSEEEALKMKIWNFIPSFLLNEAQEIASRVISGETIPSLETRRITKHGKIIDVLFTASVVFDTSSDLKSIAITERDITEQKAAETRTKTLNQELQKNVEQLESTNKELESFSYSVSHDLRAPLRAIMGFSRIVQEDYSSGLDAEGLRLFGNIEGNAKKMGMLIDDLLEFSRLGRKEINKIEVDLNELVSMVLKEVVEASGHNPSLKIKPLHNASADYSLLNQVLVNLVSNAVKYSGKVGSPVIEIGSDETDTEYIYYVKDNGAGFNMKYYDKLFGVFQRLHDPREFEGTGVGLAIVSRIITRHGGRVWAQAKVNEGATFYFSLPK
jgi:PAS domain S-box-containing protein